MSESLHDHHHYKGKSLSRSERVERKVIEFILSSTIPDDERENSVVWELKHSSGCIQIARILAQMRGLDLELAETIAALHDIYAIQAGKYKDHARLGSQIAAELLQEIGDFNPKEISLISNAIAQHSEKHVYSEDRYVELIKDVDVFDCSLYKNAAGYYSLHKPPAILAEYKNRIENVRRELGLPIQTIFRD